MNNQLNRTISVYANADEVAAAVADSIIRAAQEACAARGRFTIALAGGSSPRAAYELLAQSPRREAISWNQILVCFGDERCVAPTNSESNYRMAQETFLTHVPIHPDQILRMRGENEPVAAAQEYARELQRHLGDEPVLDYVLLGLGPDAHTASWFPDVGIDEDALVAAPFVPKFASYRLTLTPRVINGARGIVVATCGAEKADAMAAVMGPDRQPSHIPSQRLQPKNGHIRWLIDEAAANKLSSIP